MVPRSILWVGACVWATTAADRPEVPLWPGGAPGSEGKTATEVVEAPNAAHGYLKVTGVHKPSLTVFLPEPAKATGAAVIIAPGGGHQFLNFGRNLCRGVSEPHWRRGVRVEVPAGS